MNTDVTSMDQFTDAQLHSMQQRLIAGFDLGKADTSDQQLCQGLLLKVAKGASPEEFVGFMREQDLPAIKLTNEEMEAAKGGGLLLLLIGFGILCVLNAIRK